MFVGVSGGVMNPIVELAMNSCLLDDHLTPPLLLFSDSFFSRLLPI